MSINVSATDLARYEEQIPWLKEKSEVARAVVATLPEHQATAFRLFLAVYFGPGTMHSEEEIAQIIGSTPHAVHSLNMQTLEAIGKEWRRRKGITGGKGPTRQGHS